MKTHEQFADDLPLYALEELSGSERQELEQHMETCAACRREVQALRGDLSLLALESVGPRPPARSKDRLMRAIAAEPRGVSASAPAPGRRRGLSWALVPTLIAMGLLIWAGTLMQKNDALQHNLGSLSVLYKATSGQLQQAKERLQLLSAPDVDAGLAQSADCPRTRRTPPRSTARHRSGSC